VSVLSCQREAILAKELQDDSVLGNLLPIQARSSEVLQVFNRQRGKPGSAYLPDPGFCKSLTSTIPWQGSFFLTTETANSLQFCNS
jgi:hypothetical protein